MELSYHWRSQHIKLFLFRSVIHVVQSLLRFFVPNWSVTSVCQSWDVMDISFRKTSNVRIQDRTTWCPYKIEKGRLAENKLVAVADVLLLPCTATCALALPRCSLRYNRESSGAGLPYSDTLLGTGRSKNWLFAPPAHKLGAFLDHIGSRNFLQWQSFIPIWW